MEFDWDAHNESHIAMHGITREEVESALLDQPLFIGAQVHGEERRRLYVARAWNARILSIVVTKRGDRTRIVTAFPADKIARRQYIFIRGHAS